jgi:uncharacterized protein
MYIDLAQLEEGTTTIRNFVEPPESFTTQDPSLRLIQPVETRMQILKTGNHILVNGEIRTTVTLNCSRCLETIQSPANTQFALELRPKPVSGAKSQPKSDSWKIKEDETEFEDDEEIGFQIEESDIVYYTSNRIDLSEEVRQYLELAIPIQPLCKEDCAGLCSRCGTNLNKGKCSCPPLEPENPFSELKQKIVLKSQNQ